MIQAEKIFSAQQIKKADRCTIKNEPISSIDLMERAAMKCVEWLQQKFAKQNSFFIFCGPGNNGGDGLAIARLLFLSGYDAQVFIIQAEKYSEDFLTNKKRLEDLPAVAYEIFSVSDFPVIRSTDIIIDAVFGTGLSKPADGLIAECISLINKSKAKIISIDLPSGLFADTYTDPSFAVINANHTLSFQFPKIAFFFSSNENYTGDWEILDIGLDKKFIDTETTHNFFCTKEFIKALLKPRKKFSHKGTFGHAILIAGSYGKIGASVLAACSCLRSGVGLLTVHIPACGYEIMQITNPEAMVSVDKNEKLVSDEIDAEKFSAIGIGPGIGTDEQTQNAVHYVLANSKQPLVIDADALNIIGLHENWMKIIPQDSILTPHPKEFERLSGKAANDFERHKMQIAFSKKYKVFVILKGAHTCITTPSGDSYFNTTGNPGMAKGGSGDSLTGIITAMLAQKYASLESCLISVFIHGYAGDLAKDSLGETGMTAGDIAKYLPEAFKHLYDHH